MNRSQEHTEDHDHGRRAFLTTSAAAGAAAATAVLLPAGVAAGAAQPSAGGDSQRQAPGYRLTPHVADYYKSAAL